MWFDSSNLDGAFVRRHPRLKGIDVLSAAALEVAFRKERARVERTGRVFAVVVMETVDTRTLEPLIELLAERIRAYDVLGCLDANRVAVLMPETAGEGAWAAAEDVIAMLTARGGAASCRVYCYPVDWEDDHPDVPDDGRASPRLLPRLYSGDAGQPRAQCISSLGRQVLDLEPHFYQELPRWKRVMDVIVSATLLVLLSPLMLLVALAIKLTSPGPVIFAQMRAGQGGHPFRFYKFRSMHPDADDQKEQLRPENEAGATIFKIRNDRRVTPLGRFLRKSSIDELPQLWNVLKGDMTMVGPRPPTLDEVRNYKAWHRNRLAAAMGLTCIREVSGRSEVQFEDWVRMDLRYLASRSFLTDLKLLFRTILAVLSGRGAY